MVSKYKGLLDITTHPDFANEPYIYMSYNKILPGDKEAIAVARGRWDGTNIQDTHDIFVAQEGTTNGVRLLFGCRRYVVRRCLCHYRQFKQVLKP